MLQKSAGPDSLLWAEYETPTSGRGLTLRLTALDATLSLGADEEGPGIQPRYTPLNTVLEEGAMCLLLSATPQQRQDVSRFLDHRSVKTRNYPGEAPNPELNVAVEMKGGGVAKAIRGYREDAEMREDAERKLKACISAVGGNCHVVARNKDEYFAVRKAVDLDAERIHYCRDAESLGTQWQEGWTADENATIIFTGPPYLPPTAWAALKGWTQDETGPTDAMNASRRWQTERMAVEFLQTAGRGPKLWPRDERRIGQVILLNGKYALEDLKRYAETFHMDVTWETVDPDRRKIQDRGPMLAQGARGEVPLPPYARKLYSYDWPKGEWSANDAVEADLMSAETARKWNKWLVEQGLAEQHRKGGANGRTRFYRLVNKPD